MFVSQSAGRFIPGCYTLAVSEELPEEYQVKTSCLHSRKNSDATLWCLDLIIFLLVVPGDVPRQQRAVFPSQAPLSRLEVDAVVIIWTLLVSITRVHAAKWSPASSTPTITTILISITSIIIIKGYSTNNINGNSTQLVCSPFINQHLFTTSCN